MENSGKEWQIMANSGKQSQIPQVSAHTIRCHAQYIEQMCLQSGSNLQLLVTMVDGYQRFTCDC